MLLGSTNIDKNYLKSIYNNIDKIKIYSDSLIPKEFKHVKEIQWNQLYYITMHLRHLGINDYIGLRSTIHHLLHDVKITGYVDEVIEVSFLYNIVDMDRVNLFLERL